MQPRNNFYIIVSTISIPVIAITGMLFYLAHVKQTEKTVLTVATPPPTPRVTPTPEPFPEIALTAKAAIVYDTETNRILFSKNADEPLPLASITKLMTALVASEIAPGYSLITLDKDALSAEGDSGLRANEIWKLQDLLDFTLTVSSNDGARAIANVIGAWQQPDQTPTLGREHFVSLMNAKAKLLQLSTTRFINETGLDVDNKTPGAVGSALDVSKLMLSILTKKPELLSATRKEKIEVQSGSLISHNASNTNEKLNRIQNIIASKTGFTDLAGGNLTIAFSVPVQEIEHVIVVVVLGSTLEGRFTDTETLSSATQLYLTKQ